MASRTGKRFRKVYFRYMKRTLAPPEGSFTPGDATSDFVQNLAQKHEVAWFTAAEATYGPEYTGNPHGPRRPGQGL
jgi:hypothetical protein